MANFLSLYGTDTVYINKVLLTSFSTGEVAKLTFPTEIGTVKSGKDGNSIFVKNESGNQATLEVKVLRGSVDDKALNSIVVSYKSNPTLFVLVSASIVKFIGSGTGVATSTISDTYTMSNGIPTKQVEAVVNYEGDTEQALAVYTFTFSSCERSVV